MTDVNEPVIIEFIGLPGSGKTSVSDEVVELLKNNFNKEIVIVTAADVRNYWKSNLFSIIKFRIFLEGLSTLLQQPLIFMYFLFNSPGQIKRLFSIFVYDRYLKYVKSSGYADIFIFDQWVLQGIWSLFALNTRNNYQNILSKIINTIESPDIIIYLDTNRKIISERIASRKDNGSRFEGDDVKDISARLTGKKDIYNYILTSISKNIKGFYKLDADDTVNSLALSVYESVVDNVVMKSVFQAD